MAEPGNEGPQRSGSKAKGVLIAIAAVIVAGAAGYGGGRVQGMTETDVAREEQAAITAEVRGALETAENDAETARADVVVANGQTAEMRGVALRLDALRAVLDASDQIDAQNFGSAAELLQRAAAKLEAAAGDDPAITQLAQQMRTHQVVASQDPTEQKQQLLAFAARLDAAIPEVALE
jgi:hypothetical protein